MNCVLFAKMDQVFSKENKTPKKYWKIGKNTGKVREKSGNFVIPEKWEPCQNTEIIGECCMDVRDVMRPCINVLLIEIKSVLHLDSFQGSRNVTHYSVI